ncbi:MULTISPECIES: amino acid ABC transporter permease [unclassified Sinorhizobium]|uniref:amino acid ABC transporter permease n=1 Tax=unclassified Sinorhizobium TaxID=2613772 RepID=UPI0024C33A16|nr:MULTISPECIES: amino acid ABC transporter permease [unclassified Sinorhizobium]MDK1376785.1 amino acid ABC transporter permease [Sinorhizobium sp. 6-70]MDK1479556.1 amino acid ABC transporter permease [Sinorhizobium sp. 6-117]
MTSLVTMNYAMAATELVAPRKAPPAKRMPILKVLFGDMLSALLTLGAVAVILSLLPAFRWAVTDAVWLTDDPSACRSGGACWAFIEAKFRFIMFGLYPPGEQWRPATVIALLLGMTLISLSPALWGRKLVYVWAAAVCAMLTLMWGGFAGLSHVSTAKWGGLPVTLLLALLSLGLGFPFAILLALGRRSSLPILRLLSVGLIETVRGLPLVGLLFVASILLPLLLPPELDIDKLGRTLAALTVFSAAYLAEVLRGGLQAIPPGQVEAAQALGIPHWKAIRHIVLPQAIQKVIPPLTNTAIVMVKNTSLVIIVGVFDMLSAGRSAAMDPLWPGPYTEAYLFVGVIYFSICVGISYYARWLELRVKAKDYR